MHGKIRKKGVNMSNTIITIAREFGSGGRELGRRLAEILGFDYYDKEIVSEIAKRTSFSEAYVQKVVENNPHELFPITVGHSFSYLDGRILQQKQAVFAEQENVIREMAQKSNCVIVGRCADYILKDLNPYRIFVYADIKSKLERCKKRNDHDGNISDEKYIRYIKKIDRQRKRYYEFFTAHKWGQKLNYDLCINTSFLDIKEIAPHFAAIFKSR